MSMKGKVVIVTGSNRGIGFNTAKSLAKRGAKVIIACRNEARGMAAMKYIIAATGNHNVIYKKLDLASLESVRQFANDIMSTEPHLHVLINNAGIYLRDDYTDDGIIETIQINYFSHFLLTILLLPLLKKSSPSRIINLSSVLHIFGRINFYTINTHTGFLGSFRNYCDSKLCMLLFTRELSRRLESSGVVVNAVHPGVILTGIGEKLTFLSKVIFWSWSLLYGRSSEQGASIVEHVAVSEECATVSGRYFVDCDTGYIPSKAKSELVAKSLWYYSEKVVKI